MGIRGDSVPVFWRPFFWIDAEVVRVLPPWRSERAGVPFAPSGQRVLERGLTEAVRLVWLLGPAGFPAGSGVKKRAKWQSKER